MDSNKQIVITDADVAAVAQKFEARQSVAKMAALRLKQKSYDEIAEICGCSKATVAKYLHKFSQWIEEPDELIAYRENKPDFFEGVELKIMTLLHERLNDPTYKPSIKDLANAMKVFVEMRRLETGQSTSNEAIFIKSITSAHDNLFVDATEVKEIPAHDVGNS